MDIFSNLRAASAAFSFNILNRYSTSFTKLGLENTSREDLVKRFETVIKNLLNYKNAVNVEIEDVKVEVIEAMSILLYLLLFLNKEIDDK